MSVHKSRLPALVFKVNQRDQRSIMSRKTIKPKRKSKSDVKSAADRAEKRSKGVIEEITKAEIDPVIIQADEIKTKLGRPPKYRKEFARIAGALCRRGATDLELAEEFDVTTVTIWRWTVQHEEFCSAVKVAKNSFDDRIERSLAQRAVGYSYNTEKVFNFQGEIVRATVVEHVPPDVSAARLWLTNRRPDRWQDISKREVGRPGDFDGMDDAELDEYIDREGSTLRKMQLSDKTGGSRR